MVGIQGVAVRKMKAVIADEHDDFVSVIEGPEDVILSLKTFLTAFDHYEHPMCWGSEEFVDFLNDVVLKDREEKVVILELYTDEHDKSLPKLRI